MSAQCDCGHRLVEHLPWGGCLGGGLDAPPCGCGAGRCVSSLHGSKRGTPWMLACVLRSGHDGSHENKNGIRWSAASVTATGSDCLADPDAYTGDWSSWYSRQDRGRRQ